MNTDTKTTYVCATGLDHPKGRNERGDIYTGPAKSLPWLIEQGIVVAEGSDEHGAIAAELVDEKQEA
jgi:hypothetical protein